MAVRVCVFTTTVSARARRALYRTSGASALAFASIALPQAAFAQNECGVPTGSSVICTSAGNPYATGITYIAPPQDLTIALDPDVVVDTTGGPSIGVLAVADPVHSITINADSGASITTSDVGAFGVLAGTTAGNATVNTGSVTTHGDIAIGVLALADTGNVAVNAGTVYTDGAGAHGIAAYTGAGNITANGFTVITNGPAANGFDLNTQGGNIDVTLARGIFGGTVETNGDGSVGVSATTAGAGTISIVGNGPSGFGPSAVITNGAGSTGVLATAADGNVLIDLSQVQTTGAGSDAIVATSTGGAVTVNAQTVTADDGRGIVATGATGATVMQSGNFIGTGGDSHAAVTAATASGTALADIGTAFTSGGYSRAVDVRSTTGDAIAKVGSATTSGLGSAGVHVSGGNSGSATVGSIRTYGDYSDAVDAISANGTATVANNGDIRTTGFDSYGVFAAAPVSVNISGAGTVSTTGNGAIGIDGESAGTISIINSGAVSTTGAAAAGIVGRSTAGPVTIVSGAVSTTGADAIAIGALGTTASVTANGNVLRTGALGTLSPAAAIGVQSTTGTASANVGNVTASGTGISAILINGATTSAVTVRSGGIVSGALDGINTTSVAGSTVNNAGVINTGTGYAIRATGGATVVNNSGTINGRVLLTDAADTLTNTGTFNATQVSSFGAGNDAVVNAGKFNVTAGGGLDFGAGTDSFTNSGTLFLLPASATAGTVSFANLETFNNSGLIQLSNGHTGDTLNLGTAAFNGTGASKLGLDVQLGGAIATSDRLITGAATGSTAIVLTDLTTGVPLLNPGIVLVQGGAGSAAGAFSLANGPVSHGFASYNLRFNAADNSYLLVGAPSLAAYRTVKIGEGARSLWYKSADAWSAHMTALRDATWASKDGGVQAPGSGLWVQMFGSTDSRRNATQSFTTLGVTSSNNLAYNQDAYGGQVGFDFGAPKPEGALVFGVTGGYLSSVLGYSGSTDRVKFDAINGGAYASFVSGSFFLNALGKYDYYWVDTSLGGNRDKLKGNSYGAQGEAGIRFGGAKFFAEPVAQVAYVKTDLDNLVAPGFVFNFDERDGLRGKAGLRLGGAFDLGASKALVYASGMAVHEFRGQDRVDLTSGGQTVSFTNARIGTYGQGTLGFNVTMPGGINGFVEGFGDYGNDYRGGGGRAGLRMKF